MGIAQLIFKKGNFIGEIKLDIIVSETTNTSSTITSNPVENGSDVNDNIIINPMSFTINGVVSDNKVYPFGGFNKSSKILAGVDFSNVSTPSKEAWEELLELQASRVPFSLVTNLKKYSNVVIESLSTTQDKDTSNSLHFVANLKEIILVGSKIITAEQFNESSVADMAVANIDGGFK